MAEMGAQQVPLSVLRRLDRIYGLGTATTKPGERAPPISLSGLAEQLGVHVARPPPEALVLVVGEASCGKSAFVNALAQDLVLPVGTAASAGAQKAQLPLQWARADAADSTSPRLLLDAASRFPSWPSGGNSDLLARCCAGRSSSQRLDGIEIVEVRFPIDASDSEAVGWIAARADVIVCLLDSQRQPSISDELLQWLAGFSAAESQTARGAGVNERSAGTGAQQGTAQPALQFVMSKADLITRESEKIRLLAKASRLLTDRFRCGFEVLPVATGDMSVLLGEVYAEAVPRAITVGGKEFSMPVSLTDNSATGARGGAKKFEQGPLRVIRAAQACATERAGASVDAAQNDCRTLAAAVAARKSQVAVGTSQKSLRPMLLQSSIVLAIVAGAVPYILDDDVEPWMVEVWMYGAGALAIVLLLAALLVGSPKPPPTSLTTTDLTPHLLACREQERFLQLVLRQCSIWTGKSLQEACDSARDADGDTSVSSAGASVANDATSGGGDGVKRRPGGKGSGVDI